VPLPKIVCALSIAVVTEICKPYRSWADIGVNEAQGRAATNLRLLNLFCAFRGMGADRSVGAAWERSDPPGWL